MSTQITMDIGEQVQQTNIRFGGISPVVLRELSGVYQPFVKAVKEIISNSYDADADSTKLDFQDDFARLVIEDDGAGMNPIEFVRDYIRIGKSQRKDEFTAIKRRPRIGGKGIGFLAPARYCERLEVRTKKASTSVMQIPIEVRGYRIDLEEILLSGHGDKTILDHIKINRCLVNGAEVKYEHTGKFELFFFEFVTTSMIEIEFDSRNMILNAVIDFNLLFNLDAAKSLEEIENFCTVTIERTTDPQEVAASYTRITMQDLKPFVQAELKDRGKQRARNIQSMAGVEQFLWNLSRIIPVKANLHSHLPHEVQGFVQSDMDGEDKGYPIIVNCAANDKERPLQRFIVEPTWEMTMQDDGDLIRILNYEEGDFRAYGFLIGQTSTIYPAECRGILLRVKGVAIGEPGYFGLDQILTGSAKVALSQISGEINIVSGIDAVQDINPGRDGFYKESAAYNFLRRQLVGESENVKGDLKNIMDAIVTRSEVNASITNFVKKHEGQRKAILEASAVISEMSSDIPEIIDPFFEQKPKYDMLLAPAVPYKAEGKLASYSVKIAEDVSGQYKIDYVNKELLLSSRADIWKKNMYIAGNNFELVFKQCKEKAVFCEVNPKAGKIFINWTNPMRTTMGDAAYIKHCLATVASGLPQDQLLTYITVLTQRI